MSDYVRLDPTEIVRGRPFTNPSGSAEDLAGLRQMAHRLRLILSQAGGVPDKPRPFILNIWEADGHCHRIVISQREALLASAELALVGFFGQKRLGVDGTPLNAVDEELIGEFAQHPGLLSYSSLELEDGNWGNLVVLNSDEAREHWKTSARHTYASRDLAPSYYTTIRLHNGRLPRGLLAGSDLVLLRTKYYDFQGEIPWRAVREYL